MVLRPSTETDGGSMRAMAVDSARTSTDRIGRPRHHAAARRRPLTSHATARYQRPRRSDETGGGVRGGCHSSTCTSTPSTACSTAPTRSRSCAAGEGARHAGGARSPTTATCSARSSSTTRRSDAGVQADHRLRGVRRAAARKDRPARDRRLRGRRQLPPDPARHEPRRLSQPLPAGDAPATRGLLLQAAHRQGAAAGAERGA